MNILDLQILPCPRLHIRTSKDWILPNFLRCAPTSLGPCILVLRWTSTFLSDLKSWIAPLPAGLNFLRLLWAIPVSPPGTDVVRSWGRRSYSVRCCTYIYVLFRLYLDISSLLVLDVVRTMGPTLICLMRFARTGMYALSQHTSLWGGLFSSDFHIPDLAHSPSLIPWIAPGSPDLLPSSPLGNPIVP